MVTKTAAPVRKTLKNIQTQFFQTQSILLIMLALFLGVAGILINIYFETEKRDQNLQNVAQVIARSPFLTEMESGESDALSKYLDSLGASLEDIDVISVVNNDAKRIYHSNHELIGTAYDGTFPDFETSAKKYYAVDEQGPSGTQRRAYAAVYNSEGERIGFVMAIMLMKNIHSETYQMLFIFALITAAAVFMELIISGELFRKLKKSLLGYEPDVFSAMYKMRDNILESLKEGIIAVDGSGQVQFANDAAVSMLQSFSLEDIVGRNILDTEAGALLKNTLQSGQKEFGTAIGGTDILMDSIPLKEEQALVGAVGILHNRTEYIQLMEDLAGTRYLVDSMRANNHDFTNKLHVILGLLQMEMYDEATSYIQNITFVQRATISKIMNAVSEPAVAALLIGKSARASELNIKFVLREGSCYTPADMRLPSDVLVTVIGNLLDNAFESMDPSDDYDAPKELLFGIYSRSGAVLITVDDTGSGIAEQDMEHIFENGYSTKGEGRGTGLYQVKMMVQGCGGTISAESQPGVGTSFSVSFTDQSVKGEKNV